MKNHGEKWINFFHIDNGGEFINKNIRKICEINGIIKKSTMSYTLEQNGIAKWKKKKKKDHWSKVFNLYETMQNYLMVSKVK
jgi:hypothetical protein